MKALKMLHKKHAFGVFLKELFPVESVFGKIHFTGKTHPDG